jgi:protein-S-isoprenylcysteine O-methyltransferase Ste14
MRSTVTTSTPNPPIRAILVFAGLAAYLGLAVWGEGGFRAAYAHPGLVALAAVLLALTSASLFTEGNISPGVREDRGNRWVLGAILIIALADGYVPALCDRLNLLTIGGDAVRWIGVAIVALGGSLRLWPVFVLGSRFSGLVAIQPGHELVMTGIYGTIRHPSYLGLVLTMLGWGFAFRSWIGVALALSFVPFLIVRIIAEEKLLGEQFGAQYEAYRARTWRLIPGVY